MLLKEFNSTDIQLDAKKVLDAALKEPILLRRQGTDGYVILTKEKYAELVRKSESK